MLTQYQIYQTKNRILNYSKVKEMMEEEIRQARCNIFFQMKSKDIQDMAIEKIRNKYKQKIIEENRENYISDDENKENENENHNDENKENIRH